MYSLRINKIIKAGRFVILFYLVFSQIYTAFYFNKVDPREDFNKSNDEQHILTAGTFTNVINFIKVSPSSEIVNKIKLANDKEQSSPFLVLLDIQILSYNNSDKSFNFKFDHTSGNTSPRSPPSFSTL